MRKTSPPLALALALASFLARPFAWLALALAFALLLLSLAGCGQSLYLRESHRGIVQGREVVKGEPVYKIGNPYRIRGKLYTPRVNYAYKETGIASWYGPKFHNRRTANNEIFDENAISAAHRTMPLPSYALVTNLQNNRSVRLRVNDRGPFAKGRILDVSRKAARVLGFEKQGTTLVHVQILGKQSKQLAEQMKRGGKASLYGGRRTASRAPSIVPQAQASQPANTVATRAKADTAWQVYAQIGAFQQQNSLARARNKLQSLGWGLPVVTKPAPDPTLTRLLLGPLQGYDDAKIESLLDRLHDAGFPESQVRVLR